MDFKVIFAVSLTLVSCINGEESLLPSYITPCDINKDFDACILRQVEISLPFFTKGIPELGVPSIDPITLDDIKIAGNGLDLLLSDAKMFGLSGCSLSDLKVNIENEKFSLNMNCNVTVAGKYTMDGKILILPIKGNGDATIKGYNISLEIKSKIGTFKDTKGHHLKLTTPNYKYDIQKTVFTFKNLFNGNKQLSDATHQFANENWKQIMGDLAPPAIKQIVKNTIKVINKFFVKFTVDQIIKNYTAHN